jgi:hypothetical protein
MSRSPASPIARRRIVLSIGVLLVVAALSIGVGAFSAGRSAYPHARSARVDVVRGGGKPAGPATAGVQPGREPPGSAEVDVSAHGAPVVERAAPVLRTGASASFKRFTASLPGPVELTVAPLGVGMPMSLGGDRATHGWSTTKVSVLVALLQARQEDLTPQERSWAQSAITESSNESVLDLFHDLEQIEGGLVPASEYIQELFRRSGDEETVVATAPPPPGAVTTFGQTEWRPSNAVKFFSALGRGCLLQPAGTSYVLTSMRHIEPSESWGIGSVGFSRVAFKGGWGPESSGAYLVRQSGIVDVGTSRAVAVAIVAFPPPGGASFETGTAMLTQTATWLRRHLVLVPRAPVPCAGRR